MGTMPKKHGVEPQECDLQFDRAQQAWEAAEKKMKSSCRCCIFVAARELLSAGQLFVRHEGGRPAMVDLVAGIGEAFADKDLNVLVVSLRNYLHDIDRSSIDFSKEWPENWLFLAVDYLAAAVELWGANGYLDAKADTVRSRGYSGKILEVG